MKRPALLPVDRPPRPSVPLPSPLPLHLRLRWWVVMAFVGAGLAACVLWSAHRVERTGRGKPEAAATARPLGPVVRTWPVVDAGVVPGPAGALRLRHGEISATQLLGEHRRLREAANDRYMNRRVRIAGVVAEVEQTDHVVLMHLATDGSESLRALMSRAAAPVAVSTPAGKAVSLDCLHRGMVMGTPLLDDCRLPQ